MRETTVKSRNCIDARFWYHDWEAMKKSTGSHTVSSSLHTTLPWEPIHKLMDSLHTLSLIRRFTSGKAWAVRTSEEAPSYCGSSSRIVEPSSWGGMVKNIHCTERSAYGIVIVVYVLLWETFWDLLCSLDCLIPICIWNTFRYHQLRALINVESSRESSRLFRQRIVPYLLRLTHFETQNSWLTLLTKGQYKRKIICYQWYCMEQSDLPGETKIQFFWAQTKFNLNILIKKVEALNKERGRRNKGYRTHVPGQHTQLNCKSRLPTAKKTVSETYNLNNIVVGHCHEIMSAVCVQYRKWSNRSPLSNKRLLYAVKLF